ALAAAWRNIAPRDVTRQLDDLEVRLAKICDPRFGPEQLGLPGDRTLAMAIYLDQSDADTLRPLLDSPKHNVDVGQIGCYHANPIWLKSNYQDNGQPVATYEGILFSYFIYVECLPASRYRNWLRGRKEDDRKKRPASRALDTYEMLASRTTVSREDLEPLLDAARSPYFVSYDIGLT